jgi:hypothetical protein
MSDTSKQISFRVRPDLAEKIEDRTGAPSTQQSPHTAVRAALRRYIEILSRSLPDLSEEEWTVIFDIYNGTITEPWALSIAYANVEDTPEEVFERHGADKQTLVEKARGWTVAEAAAVVDMAEQYWSAVRKDSEFDRDKLRPRSKRSSSGPGNGPSGDGASA